MKGRGRRVEAAEPGAQAIAEGFRLEYADDRELRPAELPVDDALDAAGGARLGPRS